ncbi:MAG: ribosome assembly RNA-binding protein YhbY [Myxococcales bacterium]
MEPSDLDPAPQPTLAPAGPAPELTGKQRRHLRALGHHLHAVVQVGHEGVTPALVQQARIQIEAHELVKVKVSEGAPAGRHETAEALARETGAALAQVLGRTFLLYRARAKDPAIALP